ncbi:MAG: MarR family transcriptional regulator [Candidatus Thorarchaeota archaeon]
MMHLPKSAVIVLRHLVRGGPMCPVEISKTASLAPRTVSHALKRLVNEELCKKIPNLQDMRRPLYSPNYETAEAMVTTYGSDSPIGSQLTFMLRK